VSEGCGHDHVDTFGSGAGRRVDVCMGCEQVIRFWVDWEALQDDESLRGATVSKLLTDAQLNSLVDHAEYGHLEGQEYDRVVTLVAEVRQARTERTVMLNALEAGRRLNESADTAGTGLTVDLPAWEESVAALARVYDLTGDDR